jgi:hypothetical protein
VPAPEHGADIRKSCREIDFPAVFLLFGGFDRARKRSPRGLFCKDATEMSHGYEILLNNAAERLRKPSNRVTLAVWRSEN